MMIHTLTREATMRETYKGYTLMTMSRPFTPKELFQAVQIKRDGFIVHDCLTGDLETAKRFVDLVAAELYCPRCARNLKACQ